ncbi:MAG TPA: hypothetical protein VFF06_11240 [Polyangia bacterium]|nr:hypothetical protein [Polyangia bacterium]
MKLLAAALALWLAHAGNAPTLHGIGRAVIRVKNEFARAPERSRFSIDEALIYDRPVSEPIEIFNASIPDGDHLLEVVVRFRGRAEVRASRSFAVEPLQWTMIDVVIARDGQVRFTASTRS